MGVLAVEDSLGEPIRMHIEQVRDRPASPGGGSHLEVKNRDVVELVYLPTFGCPTRLIWHKIG